MRTWLWLELARHLGSAPGHDDGVAANLTSAFPGTLRTRVLAAGRGDDEGDPWAVERLVWTVLAVLTDGHDPDEPDDTDPLVQRFGAERLGYAQARRIADLFDRYHLHRPQLVRRWAAGDDVDAVGNPLAHQHRWQPHVWRQVRERIGRPSPPEVLPPLLAELRAGTLEVDLPERLSLFGLPVLPGGSGFVELAEAVGGAARRAPLPARSVARLVRPGADRRRGAGSSRDPPPGRRHDGRRRRAPAPAVVVAPPARDRAPVGRRRGSGLSRRGPDRRRGDRRCRRRPRCWPGSRPTCGRAGLRRVTTSWPRVTGRSSSTPPTDGAARSTWPATPSSTH